MKELKHFDSKYSNITSPKGLERRMKAWNKSTCFPGKRKGLFAAGLKTFSNDGNNFLKAKEVIQDPPPPLFFALLQGFLQRSWDNENQKKPFGALTALIWRLKKMPEIPFWRYFPPREVGKKLLAGPTCRVGCPNLDAYFRVPAKTTPQIHFYL